jgi:RNA polymerase sigma-32 factor
MARAQTLPMVVSESNLSRYLQEIRTFPMLEPDQEYMLAKRWREHNDTEAAHQLVTSTCAWSPRSPWLSRLRPPVSELISEGNVGMMQAVKRFEPDRGSASPPTLCGGSALPFKNTSCIPGRW